MTLKLSTFIPTEEPASPRNILKQLPVQTTRGNLQATPVISVLILWCKVSPQMLNVFITRCWKEKCESQTTFLSVASTSVLGHEWWMVHEAPHEDLRWSLFCWAWSISESNQCAIFEGAQVRRGDEGAHRWTDTFTFTHARTLSQQSYLNTHTHTCCNTIIYTCLQPTLWSNESHSLKGEKSNRIAQLGAKWLSGGQYFISTATASKVERAAQASEERVQT